MTLLEDFYALANTELEVFRKLFDGLEDNQLDVKLLLKDMSGRAKERELHIGWRKSTLVMRSSQQRQDPSSRVLVGSTDRRT